MGKNDEAWVTDDLDMEEGTATEAAEEETRELQFYSKDGIDVAGVHKLGTPTTAVNDS